MLEIAVEKEAQRRLHEAKHLVKAKLFTVYPKIVIKKDVEEFKKFAVEKMEYASRARKNVRIEEDPHCPSWLVNQLAAEAAAKVAANVAAKVAAKKQAEEFISKKHASFMEWVAAGFPIYTLGEMYCSWAMNPTPEIRPVGQWLPNHWYDYTDLEEAFWTHMKTKDLDCCSTCGKRPTVYRTYKPPPTCMDHSPFQKEVVGLWTANLGEVTKCGRHWNRNPHTGIGAIGDAFVLKPGKSGISLRCCENSVNLDTVGSL